MTVEKLLELREKIGDEPIIPDAEDKYEVMQMLKQPENMEEMQAAAKLNRGEDPEYSARYKAPPRKPLREGGALAEQAENVRQAGRYGDTELMHVTPEEAKGLSSLRGGVTLNPETNLPEAYVPFMIPAAAAAMSAAAPIAAGTAAAVGGTALASGLAASGPLGFGPLTVSQAAAPGFLGYGAGPLAGLTTVPSYLQGSTLAQGSSPFLNGILNTANDVFQGYADLSPVFQGGFEAMGAEILKSKITGEEITPENLLAASVLGATVAGVRGESFLVGGEEADTIAGEAIGEVTKKTGTEVAEKSLIDSFASGLQETVKDPKAWLAGGLALGPALFGGQQEQALDPVRRVAPFEPADPQFPMRPILTDPVTGEDRFSEESIVRRVVEGEGDDTGLGRQLTDPFTDPDAEIEVAEAANGGLVSLFGGGTSTSYMGMGTPQPGSHEYRLEHGQFFPPGYHPYSNPLGHRKDDSGGGAPEEEAKVFNPFKTNLADFDLQERLSRIRGSDQLDVSPSSPIFVPSGSGTATPISDAPTGIPKGDAALEDLLARFRAKRDDPIVASVTPAVEGSYEGGLVALAQGGEPIGQNTPVFEGQVPVNGDGMDDEIPYKVIPQDPEDAPDTPDIALLSSDEYVLPADVVSMLGNGSSNAGAAALDRFSKLVRKKAHGTNKQQTELNEDKELANLIR
jgi:hypothetical protein